MPVGRVIQVMLRIGVGWVFLWAGVAKAFDSHHFFSQLLTLRLFSTRQAASIALVLPWTEIVVGGCLLVNFLARGAAAVAVSLSASFAIVIGYALSQHTHASCGCFGDEAKIGYLALLRTILLFIAAWGVLWWGRHLSTPALAPKPETAPAI